MNYEDLTIQQLREEYDRLSDILWESEDIDFTQVERRHLELIVDVNDSNKIKLQQRLNTIKEVARKKGADLEAI